MPRMRFPSPAAALFHTVSVGNAADLRQRLRKWKGPLPRLDDGKTLLIASVHAQSATCVQVLLDHGVDPRETNKRGDTPLIIAGAWGLPQMIALLRPLSAPEATNQEGDNALLTCIGAQPASGWACAPLLVPYVPLNHKNHAGHTALSLAIESNPRWVEQLVGLDPEQDQRHAQALDNLWRKYSALAVDASEAPNLESLCPRWHALREQAILRDTLALPGTAESISHARRDRPLAPLQDSPPEAGTPPSVESRNRRISRRI